MLIKKKIFLPEPDYSPRKNKYNYNKYIGIKIIDIFNKWCFYKL